MTMTAREAFEKGTETFNAHDIDGFAEVLADDVVFEAPGGMRGKGKAACVAFFGGWFGAFPDAHVEVARRAHHRRRRRRGGHLHRDAQRRPPRPRWRHPADRVAPSRLDYIQVLRFRDGKHVSFNLMFDRLSMLEQLGLAPVPVPAG